MRAWCVSGVHGHLEALEALAAVAVAVAVVLVLILILVVGAVWVQENWSTWRRPEDRCGRPKEKCPGHRPLYRDVEPGYHGGSDHPSSGEGGST